MGLHTISVNVFGGTDHVVDQAKNFVAKLKGAGLSIERATVGHFDVHHDITGTAPAGTAPAGTAPASKLNTDKIATNTGEHKA